MKSSAKLTASVLLFAGLVLVNYLATQVPVRLDATAEDIYTLSPGTKSLLSKIEEPVTLTYYYSAGAKGLPISYKNYANRVEEMLRQYTRAARGKLILNVVSPEPDTPEEEQATRAGLQPQLIPGTGEQIYFGLSATHADLQEVISAFTPQREQFLEYDLSQLIYSVQVFEKHRLGLITSLPLKAPPFNPMMMQTGQPPPADQFIIGEWERSFEIVPIEATATELPANLDVLAVVHPEGLSDSLQYAVDQFLLGGHPVFLAVDPSSEYFKRQGGQQQMMMGGGAAPNTTSDLPRLLNAYGITYDVNQVTGDQRFGAPVSTGRGQIERFPHWLALPSEAFNSDAMATAQLNSMVMIESGNIGLANGGALSFTPLIHTSPEAGDLAAMTLKFAAPDAIARQLTPTGQKTLAALITGTFKTAFPEGAPAAETPPSSDADPAHSAAAKTVPAVASAPGLTEGQGTLVIVADTDWLLDTYSVRRLNFLGTQAAEPINDNLAFATNTLEFLSGSQDLISIRGKGSSVHPFTVVRDMEASAQKRYQERLTALESRLSEVQKKLSDLQAQSGDPSRLVASPEVAESIAQFQTQEVEMRRERRDIRRALREDIDALENRLLLLNLFAAPLFVGAFGLWFYRARRR